MDCSSATEPGLRGFDRAKHRVVWFDEASPELVRRVKKIAQASMGEARLAWAVRREHELVHGLVSQGQINCDVQRVGGFNKAPDPGGPGAAGGDFGVRLAGWPVPRVGVGAANLGMRGM